ncbi:MAG TPA: hypothetical protein ENO21_03450 [Firmicutes bacterium]|nr:hypothetical protein [Bacillota bacterium]
MDRLNELIRGIPRFTSLDLLDCSGGTLAVRSSEGIYVSSVQAAVELEWLLGVDDFVLFPGEGDASLARAGRRPSFENRLHRTVLQEIDGWNFTYHGHPTGLLAFSYAEQAIPISSTHARRLGLKTAGEIPVAEEQARGPEHHASRVVELLKESFGNSDVGAVLLAGDGPLVAAATLNKLIAATRLLEKIALAQMHRL